MGCKAGGTDQRTSPLADHLCPFPAPAMLKTKGMNRENKERS